MRRRRTVIAADRRVRKMKLSLVASIPAPTREEGRRKKEEGRRKKEGRREMGEGKKEYGRKRHTPRVRQKTQLVNTTV